MTSGAHTLYGGTAATTRQICHNYRALYDACSEHLLLKRSHGYYSESGSIPWDACGTGKFDLNTLRVDWEIFESGKKRSCT